MESTTDILARKAEVIPELKEKYKAAKKRAKEAEQGIEQIAKLETLQHELAWSFVDEMEEVSAVAQFLSLVAMLILFLIGHC